MGEPAASWAQVGIVWSHGFIGKRMDSSSIPHHYDPERVGRLEVRGGEEGEKG